MSHLSPDNAPERQPDATPHSISSPPKPEPAPEDNLLTRASLPHLPKQIAQQIPLNLEPFNTALDLLWAGELWREVRDRLATLQSTPPSPDPQKLMAAEAAFNALSEKDRHELLREFLTTIRNNPVKSPSIHYGAMAHIPLENSASIPTRSQQMAQALLTTGMLPSDEVGEAIYIRSADLLHTSPKLKNAAVWALGVTVSTAAWIFAPIPVGVVSTAFSYLACKEVSRSVNAHNHFAAGYILESLDAYNSVRTGVSPPIGALLNHYFHNPADPESLNNMWRADGFMIARVLRIFGKTNQEIFDGFKSPLTVFEPGHPLVASLEKIFESHGVPQPPCMVVPFIEDDGLCNIYEEAQTLIETMNQVHMTWAIRQKIETQMHFADAILAHCAGRSPA